MLTLVEFYFVKTEVLVEEQDSFPNMNLVLMKVFPQLFKLIGLICGRKQVEGDRRSSSGEGAPYFSKQEGNRQRLDSAPSQTDVCAIGS